MLYGTVLSMRYLGIDYGTKRIGIALSDEEGSFAFPKEIIDAEDAINKLADIIKTEQIEFAVVGESVASNGEGNTIDEKIKSFAEKLKEKTGVEVIFQREDFSSVEAHRYQIDKGNRDDSAAAIILQRFLDKKSMSK